MAKTHSMTRNQNNDDDETSSSRKMPKTCAPSSDLDHNLLFLVMMQLGVVDFLSFRGVCKSWRSLGCENQNMFMESRPPMLVTISTDANEKKCHLEDFEGRKFTTILPSFAGGAWVGVTCGYLIFFEKSTRDFCLVNPITRHQLHFPNSPFDYHHGKLSGRAILVFSPSISGLVYAVSCKHEIWFSIAGKGSWNYVPSSFCIIDVNAFKGKIYTVSFDSLSPSDKRVRVCELRLSPKPKLILLEIKKPDFFFPDNFVNSRENIYVRGWSPDRPNSLHELDLGEMKWLVPCEKTMEKFAFFRSELNRGVAVKRESWADPRSWSHGSFASSPDADNNQENNFFTEKMWYFPHECMDVDRRDE